MRLKGRNKPEEPTTKTAEFVLQLGNNKIQLSADRLVGATGHADDDTFRRANVSESTSDDQDKAIDDLMRMRRTLHQSPANPASGPVFPYSPDDLYPPHQRPHPAQNTNNLVAPQFPSGWDHRRPSNNLPEPCDTNPAPTTFCPAVPNPDIMPALRHRPTIFDNLGEMPRQRTTPPEEPQKRDSVGKKSRGLRKLIADRSPSTLKSESRSARSRHGAGVVSSTSSAGKSGRALDFGDHLLQATKTNVRRPPKGIQNWFDGFPISDDDEDEEEEEEEEEARAEQTVQRDAGRVPAQRVIAPAQMLEPQELPADDVPPPAYSHLVRGASTASRWSDRSYTPGDDNPPPFSHADEKAPTNRTDSISTTGDSLRSSHSHSHSRRQNSDSRLSRSKLASESVLALSDQSASENEMDDRHDRSHARNSIDDEHGVRLEDAARVRVRYGKPTQVSSNRTYSSDGVTSAPRGDVALPSGADRVYPGQQHYRLDSRAADPLDPATMVLRRLHGSNNVDSRVSTSSSNRTFEMENQTLLAADSISNVHSDASLMVVTEEERALLDMMRRKRAAMAQMSFTEGYHHALRREQASPMRRSASADSLAQEILDQRGHPAIETSHEIMRKKLSALQKQDVDEALKMERFLGMQSQTGEEDFAWPRDSMMPTALPSSQPRNDSHTPERYNPIYSERDSAYQTWSPHAEQYDYGDQPRYAQYATSNTMPSPLHASEFARRSSSQNDIMASPVAEEEPIPDEPDESQERGRQQDSSKKHTKRISRSVDAGPILRTAGLHFRPGQFDSTTTASPTNITFSPSTTSPLSSIITAASLGDKHRRQAGGETPDTEVSRSTLDLKKVPLHVQARDSGYNPRGSMVSITSAGEDVLAAWADLGGGSDCLQQKRRPTTATTQPQ